MQLSYCTTVQIVVAGGNSVNHCGNRRRGILLAFLLLHDVSNGGEVGVYALACRLFLWSRLKSIKKETNISFMWPP